MSLLKMTTLIKDGHQDFEDNDGFENFAAVIFAAALDHDGAYGMSGEELKHFIAAKEIKCIVGTASQYKEAPKMNMAGSKLFERRAMAAMAKATAAETTTPDFVSPYKGKAVLHLINQFWGKSASDSIKEAPKLNLVGSKLFERRAMAKAMVAVGCSS
jgi:hypothetical protein